MMEEREILVAVGAELQLTEDYTNWQQPLDYYLGNPLGNELPGRSKVQSTDIADAVEWILPQIMRALTTTDEVVTFDATGPEDELQAELETRYVYDVLFKENDGFITIHNFVKDALIHRFGVIKVYYESTPQTKTMEFSGIDPQVAQGALMRPDVEVLAYEQDPLLGLVAMKIAITNSRGRVVLESVPPEQFRVSKDHDSINLDAARFTAHITTKTVSDLIQEGYDPGIIDEIGFGAGYRYSDFRFWAQGEAPVHPEAFYSEDPSMREIEVSECFMQLDANEDGIAEYVKVIVAGGSKTPSKVLAIEEIDYCPWVATTAILMPHKMKGLSLFDRLREVQEQKTAILRNILDNFYHQNNATRVVVEGMVNLEDASISKPGHIIRARDPNAVVALTTPAIGAEAFTLMQYLDEVRAGRSGVSPEGTATPQNIGPNVGSEGVNQLMTAKEELVGLMVRVIAETGIKPLVTKVRELLTKHVDAVQPFKFRGQWVQTCPAQWPERERVTVNVGTGSANQMKRAVAIEKVLQFQQAALQMPGQALVQPHKVFSALDDFCKFNELGGATLYFTDPNSPEGQQATQQSAQAMQEQQAQQQQQSNVILQAQAAEAQAALKVADAQEQMVQMRAQIDQLKAQLDTVNKDAERSLKKYQIDTQAALQLTKIEADAKAQEDANYLQNQALVQGESSEADE